MHAAQNARRMEEVFRELALPIGGTKAKHIGVGDGPGPQTRAKNVSVHPNDAGHGAAVRVQGRRGIVGFSLHAHAPRIVPCDHSGVVVKHRKKPINLLLHVVCRFHDVGFEDGIDDGVFSGLVVNVVYF